jgi:outer membrane protein assembly factor BamB
MREVINFSCAEGSDEAQGESSPAVANGMVYVGSYDEHKVYAFGLQ